MNRPDLDGSLMSYFSEIIKDRDVKFCQNLFSNLQFVVSKLKINIFANFNENYALFGNVTILNNFFFD